MATEVDVRHVDAAAVYKGDELAGAIERDGDATTFRYVEGYAGRAVATRLPRSSGPVVRTGGALHPFFAGLLPEGLRLLALTARVKTSADDMLSLLLAVGRDCIGDVRVLPAGADPVDPPPRRPMGPAWSELDFTDLLGQEQIDIALPGVQEKVSDQMISIPVGASDGSFILKLNPPRYPRLVENEAFFLAVARHAGLEAADAEVVTDRNGERGLWVRRFDRRRVRRRLVRLEQEDACQFCGQYPSEKYRLSINEITAELVELVDSPPAAVLDLVRLVAFSYAIANGDLHAKNISILRRGDVVGLAPAYDVLSDLPYSSSDHMALPLDGRDRNLTRSTFVGFARRFAVPARAVERALDRICDVLPGAAERLEEIGLDERKTSHLRRVMLARRDDLA